MLQHDEYGLKEVPVAKRRLGWWDLTLIWGGISFCLPTFMISALPVPGIGWNEALWVNVAGNAVCAIFIALSGSAGVKYGLPSVVILQNMFGPLIGGKALPLLIFFSTLGWFGLMVAATADGIAELILLNPASHVILMIALGAGMTLTAALGNRVIVMLNTVSLPLLLFAIGYFFFNIVKLYSGAINYAPTGETGFNEVLNLIIAGYIVGAICASDFTRYTQSNRANWLGSFFGVWLVSLLLSIVAMYAKTVTGQWNPIKAFYAADMPLFFVMTVLFSAWTTNQALVYSAGLALAKVTGTDRQFALTLSSGAIGTLIACTKFAADLELFLSSLGIIFPGILGIMLSRHFIIGRHAKITSLKHAAVFFASTASSIAVSIYSPPELIPSLAGVVSGGGVYCVLLFITLNVNKIKTLTFIK